MKALPTLIHEQRNEPLPEGESLQVTITLPEGEPIEATLTLVKEELTSSMDVGYSILIVIIYLILLKPLMTFMLWLGDQF